jgi:hypothetical protein
MYRLLLASGALALLTLAGSIFVLKQLVLPPCYHTAEKCERIKLGMPVDKIQDILWPVIPCIAGTAIGGACFFECPDGLLWVAYDMDGLVTAYEFRPHPPPCFWARLREWLPW